MADQSAVALPGAAAEPVGNAAEPTVVVEDAAGGEPATAGGAPPAAAKAKKKKQSTLQLQAPTVVSPPAAAVAQPSLAAQADLARTALAVAKVTRAGSPSRISIGWIEEGKTERTKSIRELIEVSRQGLHWSTTRATACERTSPSTSYDASTSASCTC